MKTRGILRILPERSGVSPLAVSMVSSSIILLSKAVSRLTKTDAMLLKVNSAFISGSEPSSSSYSSCLHSGSFQLRNFLFTLFHPDLNT